MTLEIMIDKGFKQTTYWTMNYSIGSDAICFQGTNINNKYIRPLMQAKIWAKEHGYDNLLVISNTLRKSDKLYNLK